MTKTILVAALAALVSTSALADHVSRTTCGRTYMGRYECSSTFTRTSPVGPKAADMRTREEIQAEDDAWVAYCQPRRGPPDKYGVVRLIYAHPGCDLGIVR